MLLLETGFLSIFFAPWRLWPNRSCSGSRTTAKGDDSPATACHHRSPGFACRFVFAQASSVQTDADVGRGEANQRRRQLVEPDGARLPLLVATAADGIRAGGRIKSPEWFKHFSVAFCLVVEIIVPFFIWAPRRLRLIAAGLLIFLQLAIAITGNYCFFNLLTIALCLLLIDDAVDRPSFGGASSREPAVA